MQNKSPRIKVRTVHPSDLKADELVIYRHFDNSDFQVVEIKHYKEHYRVTGYYRADFNFTNWDITKDEVKRMAERQDAKKEKSKN